MTANTRIAIAKIAVDHDIQARVALDEGTIDEYADFYRAGDTLPPVKVFHDGQKHWLADGFHRIEAAKRAGLAEIDADVQSGTRRQAVLHSAAANARHGLRRTNADKRRAVTMILGDEYWSGWSNEAVAKACRVSPHTVADVRATIPANAEIPAATRTVTRNGTTYQQRTAAIGRAPAPTTAVAVTRPAPDVAAPAVVAVSVVRQGPTEPLPIEVVVTSEVENLRDRLDETATNLRETMADNDRMAAILDADDRVAAALAEAKQARDMTRVLQSRLDGQARELAESVRLVRHWKRRAERAEGRLAKLAAEVSR